MNVPYLHRIALALALFNFASCGDHDGGPVVPVLQPISAPRKPYTVDASAAQRFPKYGDATKRFRFVPGSSWSQLSRSQFRSLNFAFGPSGVGECYVSEVSGFTDGGLSNVNRWRGQMGLGDMTASEMAAAPRKSFAGEQAVFVKLDGTYGGMGGADQRSDYRMLAMIMQRGCEAYSVKMTGPRGVIEYEESEFLAFCETLTIVPDPEAPPYTQMKIGPFEFLRPCDWDYFVPESDDIVRRPIGFKMGIKNEAETDLGIIMDAAQGDIAQVINGWLGAKGREPMTAEAIAALPDQVLMGTRGKWLEIEADGQTFIGIASQLASDGHTPMTIIATLRGPTPLINTEKIMLRTFAESLRLGPVGGGQEPPH